MPPTDELGLKGKGVEVVKIPVLTLALRKYEKAKDARVAASREEVPAKEAVL